MKTILAAAAMVSMAAADCQLSGSYQDLSLSATIPSVTTVSAACCDDMQQVVTNFFNSPDTPPADDDLNEKGKQDCQSFAEWMRENGPKSPMEVASFPSGFEFKESVSGAGATACTLHKSMGDASVSCDIPESTTISSDCCDAVQGTIDQLPSPQEGQELQQDLMTKCQSVVMFGEQLMGKLGPPPREGPPSAKLDYIAKALPAGMSCTEKTVSGASSSMLAAILSFVENSQQSEPQELEARPTSSLLLTIFVAGTAGVVGGLLAFIAASKLSRKSERVVLISDNA